MSRESKLAVSVLSTGYKLLKLLIEMSCDRQIQAECEKRECREFAFDIKRFDLIEFRCIDISTNHDLLFSISCAFFRVFLFLPF